MKMRQLEFSKVRALVIGDVMLDKYVHGCVSRISPEAPVPVFNACDTTYAAGGAANVATNLAALGCRVGLACAIGKDAEGETLLQQLNKSGIVPRFGFATADRTTSKTRFVVADKHLLRMDQDVRVQWRKRDVAEFMRWITRQLKLASVVVLSDYGKGVLAEDICPKIINLARHAHVPVMVDPKGRDYSKYRGATLIKPNLKELVEVTGCTVDLQEANWREELFRVAVRFGRRLHVGSILVTLGEKGMMYVPTGRNAKPFYLPAEVKKVFDVSGAGDTSMAVVSAALALNTPVRDAVGLANAASGIVVAKRGTSVVSVSELEVACSTKTSVGNCSATSSARRMRGATSA